MASDRQNNDVTKAAQNDTIIDTVKGGSLFHSERKGCVDLVRIPEKAWIRYIAPLVLAILTCIGVIVPPVLLLCVYLSVYYDARLGGWAQTVVMGVVLALVGGWIWGAAGLGLWFICMIPTIAALFFFKKRAGFADGLVYSFAAAFLALALSMLLVYLLYRQDPLTVLLSALEQLFRRQGEGSALVTMAAAQQALLEWAMDASAADFASLNRLMTEIASLPMDKFIERVMPTYEGIIRLYAPTVVIILTALVGASAWIFPGFALKNRFYGQKSLDRCIVPTSLPPSFIRWSLPRSLLLGCMLVMVIAFFTQTTTNTVLASGVNALYWIAQALLMIQGVSFAAFWLRSKGVPLGARVALLLIGSAFLGTAFMLLGIADTSFQFRRMFLLRGHTVQMQALVNRYKDDPRELDIHVRAFIAKLEREQEEEACMERTPRKRQGGSDGQDTTNSSDPEDHV